MNRWQEIYVDRVCNGKKPRSKAAQNELKILGSVRNYVVVDFPDFNGLKGLVPAHKETYRVVEDGVDMPNGIIDVRVLATNLILWLSRGYKVSTY